MTWKLLQDFPLDPKRDMRLDITLGLILGLCHGWIASDPHTRTTPSGSVLSVSLVTLSAPAADFLAEPRQ
jgi:hypothetical protein